MRAIDRRAGQLTVPRRRGRRLRRLMLLAIIPLAAIGVLVWGWSGLNDPPDFLGGLSDAEPTSTAVLAIIDEATPTIVVAISPTSSPVPIASPAGTALPTPTAIYTPAPTEPPVPSTATPVPPTPSPTPRPAPTATPTAVVITGCAAPPAAATRGDTRTVVTNAISLNMRARPGVNCNVVLNLAFGTELQARGRPIEADGFQWLQVTLNGTTGWVATEFVDEPEPATGQT